MERIAGSEKGPRVLVIDDDPDIARLLTCVLQPQGFEVYKACDGKEGLRNAYEFHPALVILDVMMPGMDGWDVCVRLRELSDVPILMLTIRSAEADMLRGFALGADDYVKKPFSQAELVARVRALLRSRQDHGPSPHISHYADRFLNIDLETQTVELNGERLDLSRTQYRLLACLVRNLGITVTHEQLLREVWDCEYGNMSASLTLCIHNLRKKLKNPLYKHEYLQTHWRRGYCFVPLNEI
jgi:two-component system KDP operon response regulator KdpE